MTRARASGVVAAQPGNAAFAASTARPTSAAVANGTRASERAGGGRVDIAEAAGGAGRALAADPVGERGDIGLAQGGGGGHGGISEDRAAHGIGTAPMPAPTQFSAFAERELPSGTGKMRRLRERDAARDGRDAKQEETVDEAAGLRRRGRHDPVRQAGRERALRRHGRRAPPSRRSPTPASRTPTSQQAYVGYVYGDSTCRPEGALSRRHDRHPDLQRQQQLLDRIDRALPRAAGGRERRRRLRAGAGLRADDARRARHALQRPSDAVRRFQSRDRCARRRARRSARDPLLRRRRPRAHAEVRHDARDVRQHSRQGEPARDEQSAGALPRAKSASTTCSRRRC